MIHISTFSGVGGFELSAQWMGWKNYASCEINPFGSKVLQYYWPQAYHHGDIHTLTYELLNEQLIQRFGEGWRNEPIVLTGGFPCQPFSLAGKRKGTEDDRHLWPEMLRLIREIAPEYIVGENVGGIVSWDGGLVFEQVQIDLETEGYEVQPIILPACAVNAPHRRDRVWFIAHSPSVRSGGRDDKSRSNESKFERGMDENIRQNRDKIWCQTEGCSGEWTTPNNSDARVESLQSGENRVYEPKLIANTTSKSGEWMQSEQREFGKSEQGQFRGVNSKMGGVTYTNTNGRRLSGEKHWKEESGWFAEKSIPGDWSNFPTQPPVRSRNDGISPGLVGITVPKHRNESIKAYGNSVVPPLVLQIFKAIQQYENNHHPKGA